jgi:hypothetical protein
MFETLPIISGAWTIDASHFIVSWRGQINLLRRPGQGRDNQSDEINTHGSLLASRGAVYVVLGIRVHSAEVCRSRATRVRFPPDHATVALSAGYSGQMGVDQGAFTLSRELAQDRGDHTVVATYLRTSANRSDTPSNAPKRTGERGWCLHLSFRTAVVSC